MRVRHVTLSRDFVLFMISFGVLITILLYNPYELRNVLMEIKFLGEQNGNLAEQGVNNTERIINDSAQRFHISSERTVSILNELRAYINASNIEERASGVEIIEILFLYMEDLERDINKLMVHHNVSNNHFVTINGTHAITESGITKLPYAINITSNLPDLKIVNYSLPS